MALFARRDFPEELARPIPSQAAAQGALITNQNAGTINNLFQGGASPTASPAGPLLSPIQLRLLHVLADYQQRYATHKLVIGRGDGQLVFDDDPKRGEGVSMVRDIFGTIDPSRSTEFVRLMETMPTEYVRFYPEMRWDSPFVIGVTEAGMGYLRVDSESIPKNSPRQEQVERDITAMIPQIEEIQRNRAALAESAHTRATLDRLFEQYDQLNRAITTNERFGAPGKDERLAAAEHIIGELRAILGNVERRDTPDGRALVLRTGFNTFRVTFPVPMRIPPAITFENVPNGATPNIIEKSTIGFTVIFTPPTVSVEKLPAMQAVAEL